MAIAGLLMAAALPAWALAAGEGVVIPAGTVLRVKLKTTLTSKTSKNGDKFTAIVEKPVVVDDNEIVPVGSIVEGHVAFVKPSGRVRGPGEMRIVLDKVTTPDEAKFALTGTLDDTGGNPCAKTGSDEEGTVKGCGKSKKGAAKDAALGGAIGAGAGATVGLGSSIDCRYFGNCGGPGVAQGALYGAGIGAVTALVYNLFKHENQLVLVGGSHLTFIVNRTVQSTEAPPASDSTTKPSDSNQ